MPKKTRADSLSCRPSSHSAQAVCIKKSRTRVFAVSIRSASSRATSSTEESIIANRRPLVNFTSGKTSTVCTVSRPIRNSGKNLMNFHRSRYHNTSLYASDFFFSDFLIAGLFDAGGEISDVSVSGSRRLFSRDLPAEVPSVPIQEVPWRG